MSALEEIQAALRDGEVVEAVVFGDAEDAPQGAPARTPITLDEARRHLESWTFYGDFGIVTAFPVYVWTNQRVLFTGEYDGATWIAWVPRNPEPCTPETSGFTIEEP